MALKILVGADPELFVRNIKTGEYVSAHTLMPGTKIEPHKVELGAVQVDGVAAEFNIDPASNSSAWLTNISSVMTRLQSFVGTGFELVSEPSVTFPAEYFKTLPENVRELGCNPDFNAWTGKVNDRPDGDSTTMRTAAGHIHIGWGKDIDTTDETHFEDCCVIARNLDYFLGLYSLQWDQNSDRRKLYGKAGSFRPKPYGIEYRPLSNVWLRTPELQLWVYNATTIAMQNLFSKGTRLDEIFGSLAREFIDNSEVWWTPEAQGKSKDHKRLGMLPAHTGLKSPPPLPKPVSKETSEKIVMAPKPKAKHVYGTTTGHLSGKTKEEIYAKMYVKQLASFDNVNWGTIPKLKPTDNF